MEQEHRRAQPTLTVSLTGIGPEDFRIQIPMERIPASPTRCGQAEIQPSNPTSSSGMSLKIEKIRRIPISSIYREALTGDYGQNPVEVALQMMKEIVLEILEEE